MNESVMITRIGLKVGRIHLVGKDRMDLYSQVWLGHLFR